MERLNKVFSFSATSVKQESRNGVPIGIIEGYASTWDLDRGNDVILQGAFSDSLAELRAANRTVRMLFGHESNNLIGGFPVAEMREDDNGLWVRGEVNLTAGQQGEFAYSLAKQGVLTDMSIGYGIESRDDVEFRDIDGEAVRIIKKVKLWEISMVPEPMNPHAQILSVKNSDGKIDLKKVQECKTLSDVEKLLSDVGFTREGRKCLISTIKANQRDVDGGGERDACKKLESSIANLAKLANELKNKTCEGL